MKALRLWAGKTVDYTAIEGDPPSRGRTKPFIRSAGVRFAVIYAAIFGLSACGLAFSLWYSTVGLLERQAQVAVRNDASALGDHFDVGGTAALAMAIKARLAENADNDAIYLLIDPFGNRVVGNLDRWPDGLDQSDFWYERPVSRQGVRSVALLRAYQLADGGQLLVGRDVRAPAELRHVLSNGLLWALGCMFLLGLLGAVIIRSLLRRMIRNIATTTRAIARGDLTQRVSKSGDGDEFDELAEVINDMLDRITRLMDGVREVSNSIAHDLRTPITRARTRLEDASLHARSETELRSAIDRATSDLDGIVAVFQALLRIAEIEAGTRRSAFAAFDMERLLVDIDELYRAVAEERGFTFDAGIEAVLPILGDRDLIQQAIMNLLDNAFKFSSGNAVIEFKARWFENSIEVLIADHGPGIADADRERATERFYRAETARQTPGTGLGLALVVAIVQLHGGTLRLEDNQPGLRAMIILPARFD